MTRTRTRTTAAAAAAAALTGVLVLAAPLAASAHVHVHPGTATAGADETMLTFEVPNESATATTRSVVIELPTSGAAFGEVSYQPVPGWTAKVVTAHLAKPVTVDGAKVDEVPSRVEFTAQGAGIADGEDQEFVLSVGPVPHVGRMLIPVQQTYSDGTVVRWDEKTPAGGEEPEHPAPVLYVDDAPPADDAPAGTSAATPGTASGVLPVALASSALVVAVLALVVALVAALRTRAGGVRR